MLTSRELILLSSLNHFPDRSGIFDVEFGSQSCLVIKKLVLLSTVIQDLITNTELNHVRIIEKVRIHTGLSNMVQIHKSVSLNLVIEVETLEKLFHVNGNIIEILTHIEFSRGKNR